MTVKDYYDEYWSEAGFRPLRDVPDELAAVLVAHITPGASMLDVGCGDGRTLGAWLSRRAGSYLGVDVSETAVENARSLGLDARVIGDAADLPFDDATFDVVVCSEVLEHLLDPEVAAREILRVLRPGGRLLATVPNAAYWRRRAELAGGTFNPYGDDRSLKEPWRDPHLRFFTAPTLRAMLVSAGFDWVEVGGHEGEIAGAWRLSGIVRADPARRRRLHRKLHAALAPLLAVRLYAVAFRPQQ